MKKIKLSKQEKREANKLKIKNNLEGTGIYIYENISGGDLFLTKPANNGVKNINPQKRFESDSYYMKWVGPPLNLLRLVEIKELEKTGENDMNEKKLILDQPDTVTNQGKVEHVIVNPNKQLNDSTQNEEQPEVLLNESPLDGVEIILG